MDLPVNTHIQHESPIQARATAYIADWLCRHNHTEGKEEEITGMNLNSNAVDTFTDPTMYDDGRNWTFLNRYDLLNTITAVIKCLAINQSSS